MWDSPLLTVSLGAAAAIVFGAWFLIGRHSTTERRSAIRYCTVFLLGIVWLSP